VLGIVRELAGRRRPSDTPQDPRRYHEVPAFHHATCVTRVSRSFALCREMRTLGEPMASWFCRARFARGCTALLPSRDPLARAAVRAAWVATGLLFAAASVGVMIRVLPWALEPSISWGTLAPFAKSLAEVAVEVSLMMGLPMGWAMAAGRFVERGEFRALAALGESPFRTMTRLLPQAIPFVALLVFASTLLGRDAAAPGRVVNALLAEGRASCAPGETHRVPFVSATWLCFSSPDGASAPRLVGRAPLGGLLFSAEGARVSEDLRRLELSDAQLSLAPAVQDASVPTRRVRVHVGSLVLRGLAPWARASALPASLRGGLVAFSSLAAGVTAVFGIFRAYRRRVGQLASLAIGASGPLVALGTLRALELRVPEGAPGYWLLLFATVPLAAIAGATLAVALVTTLPRRGRAGST
jgi:hypothetical protein